MYIVLDIHILTCQLLIHIQMQSKKKKAKVAEPGSSSKPPQSTASAADGSKPPLPKKQKKKLPQVPAEVEKEIRRAARMEVSRRKNDARSKVQSAFKREARLYAPQTEAGAAADGGVGSEGGAPMLPPPEPAPSVLSSLAPEQRSRLIACCNFLYAFARPLGLLYVPSLQQLVDALRALDAPTAASKAEEDGEEWSQGGEKRAEAEQLLEDLCLALVRAMAPDVEDTLGMHAGGNEAALQGVSIGRGAAGSKGGAGSGLVLPLNKLTWKEVARLSLATFVFESVGITRTWRGVEGSSQSSRPCTSARACRHLHMHTLTHAHIRTPLSRSQTRTSATS